MTGDPAWAHEQTAVQPPDPRWPGSGTARVRPLAGLLAPWLADRVEHVGSTAVPGLAAKPVLDIMAVAGFRGAYLLGRQDRGFTAIRALTLFDSLAAVREFAGERYEQGRVTPQARAALLSSGLAIQHFDVLTALR